MKRVDVVANNRNAERRPPIRWVWLDLEMTGLNVETCSIIQAAMIITDPRFNVLATKDIVIWQPESALETMSPFVREMHTKNDLIKRVRASKVSVEDAEKELLELLSKHVGYGRGVLAGNSMYVDRMFLSKYMPTFESYLHYRQLDVSSIKLVSKAWYGKKVETPKKESTHNALDDIKESIAELQHYRLTCFKAIM